MPRYVVLLRGVNLASKRRLAMADLRRILESLGHTDVTTHLQSGNAVVTSRARDAKRLSRQIHDALLDETGLDSSVMIRTGAEMADVVARNPFPAAVAQPNRLFVVFLSEPADSKRVAELNPDECAPDEYRFDGREVYLRHVTSPADNKLIPRTVGRLKLDFTARNWNTVTALTKLSAG
jgi:uncharacterized protein (DUF1697 family)